MLNYPTVSDAKNVNHIERNVSVRGRYAHELPLVRAMKRLAGHHFISSRYLVVDGGTYVGEGCKQYGDQLFCPVERGG